jgi:hypothetical protein
MDAGVLMVLRMIPAADPGRGFQPELERLGKKSLRSVILVRGSLQE